MRRIIICLLSLICHLSHSKQLLPQELHNFPAVPQLQSPQFLVAQDGINLASYSYTAQNPNVVILYPGPGLYGNSQYQWVAQTLRDCHNIDCYIFDVRGHGNSQGIRGDAKSANRIYADISLACEHVKQKHPHAKIYLAGHSTGAGLLINFAAHNSHQLADGLILIAPYLGAKYKTLKEHKLDDSGFIKQTHGLTLSLGTFFPTGFPAHQTAMHFNYSKETLQLDPLIVPSYSLTMLQATVPLMAVEVLPKIKAPAVLYVDEKTHNRLTKSKPLSKILSAQTTMQTINDVSFASMLQQIPDLIAQAIAQL